MSLLPVTPAYELARTPPEARWLIEDLWAEGAVGVIGGEPKCCKSFLALDVAVAVASGTDCLRKYPPRRTGRVLLYAAEDSLPMVRERLEGIAAAAGEDLAALDIQVITSPTLRLDLETDRRRLTATVEKLRPVLLVLDPFIRLHRVDENVAAEVSPLLAYLRELQRGYDLAVVVVHHAKKGAGRERPGQALRGSSEFHGWGDSNLYLRRDKERLLLSIEHRAAPSETDIPLTLEGDDDTLALAVQDEPVGPSHEENSISVAERVTAALSGGNGPIPVRILRERCRIKMNTLSDVLKDLVAAGRVVRGEKGYELA